MKRRRILETVAWTTGVALLAAYAAARCWQTQARDEGIAAFNAERQNIVSIGADEPLPAWALPDPTDWSPQRAARYRQSLQDKSPPIAVLRIPTAQLVVPIFEGTSEHNLNRGAGRIEGTARIGKPGNLGIAAHRDGFFRALKDVRVGDKLFVDRAAVTDTYRVASIRIVEPHDVEVLEPTTMRSVTLVTCYPFYYVGPAPRRYIVRAQIAADCSKHEKEPCSSPQERKAPQSHVLVELSDAEKN
jgi:sortase A